MVKKYDPSYLRELKSYREHRTGVLQVSKKTIKPSFLQNMNSNYQNNNNNTINRNNVNNQLSSYGMNYNSNSNNGSKNTKINEAVAEYKIKSYALNDRLFVKSLDGDNNNFQSSDRPPLVRYSHLPNTLKYERISVPTTLLDKPTSIDNCMLPEHVVEPSLAAAAHCTHGWIAPRSHKMNNRKKKKNVDKGGRTFGDLDIRSAMSEINYEEQILNHVNEGINKSTLRGMLIVADDNNEYNYNNITNNNGMANKYTSPYRKKSYTENEYADGVINQPRTWGVGRSEYYNHFSSATKNLLQKEEQVRKPILRRVKMY